jgi:hypothetical protein
MVINICVRGQQRAMARGLGGMHQHMLATLRKLLSSQMTIAEWIGTGLLLSLPYVALGIVWSVANASRFEGLHGVELVLAVVGAVLAWPVLLLPNMCTS